MLDEHGLDWNELRAQSLRPGGFGEERTRIWPALLGVHVPSEPPPYTEVSTDSSTDVPPHPDEHQVRLDTNRSFVIYPADSDDKSHKESMQSSLNALIVSLLRKRPKLRYFQGYHDIVTVVFLTLPPGLQLPCIEKLSLHRVRDSMGPTLEPVLGLLRIVRNLMRVIDPPYAKLLESVAPLPFHALSNLLTLFSHEVPTLPLIQHVWDFLLCREPLAAVWLAAAVILVRKPDVLKLVTEGDDGMIHSVLNALPPLSEGYEAKDDVSSDHHVLSGPLDEGDDVPFSTEEAWPPSEASDEDTRNELPIEQHEIIDQRSGAAFEDTKLDADHPSENLNIQPSDNAYPALLSVQLQEAEDSAGTIPSDTRVGNTTDINVDTDFVRPQPPSRLSKSSMPRVLPRASKLNSRTASGPPSFSRKPGKNLPPPILLPSLLTHAAQLLEAYPPTLPELHVKEIFGSKSAIHTWRPPSPRDGFSIQSDNERDDAAESWVGGPDVVIPCVEDDETERKTPVMKQRSPFLLHRLRLRLEVLKPTEKRILLIGAVAVIGLAIAFQQNRGLSDMQKGWIAWAWAFAGGIQSRTVM